MKMRKKLKNILINLFNKIKEYEITILIISSFSIFFSFFLNYDFNQEFIISLFTTFLVLSTGSFFTETYLKNNKKLWIISILLSILLIIINHINLNIMKDYLYRVVICYTLITTIATLYKIYLNSKLDISEYTLRVFSNIVKYTVIYLILLFGILLLGGLFTYLVLDIDSLIERLIIITLGVFYVPCIISSLTNTKEKVENFITYIVKNILSPLSIIAFTIIYIYIIKILISRNIPSNKIFSILLILFILSLPVWTMCCAFKKSNLTNKLTTKLPILFIPFIFLQIYVIQIRISNYGLTPIRYLGVLFIITEIIYITIYIYKRKKIEVMFYIISALILISLVVPYINMYDLTTTNHISRIRRYLKLEELKNNEIESLINSYEYIAVDNNNKYILDKKLTKKEQDKIKEYYKNRCIYTEKNKIIGTLYKNNINVEGYKTVSTFNIENGKENSINEEFKHIRIIDENFDLTNIIKNYINESKKYDFDTYFNDNYELIIDENKKLVLNAIDIVYYQNIIEYYYIEGYLLKK